MPTLETPRLRLRTHTASDLPACQAMWSDPAVTRFTIGAPSPESQTWRRILAYLGHWQVMGYGYWAVEEKTSGRYIGELGFADFKRDIQPSIRGTPELGWALASSAHGKGYATEALKAALAWGEEHLPAERTVAIIMPINTASLRVAQKLGFREYARSTTPGPSGAPDLLFERSLRN